MGEIDFNMILSLFNTSDTIEAVTLFSRVFSDSEGESEGKVIGNLVSDLIKTTGSQDLIGYVAKAGSRMVGCIFFSRFFVPNGQPAFILSPVAVSTNEQGNGIGQELINFGVNHLKSQGVHMIFTYGDPNYYSKTGFSQISESVVEAPFELSRPEGWLVQSLNGVPVKTIPGSTNCVKALNDQKYW